MLSMIGRVIIDKLVRNWRKLVWRNTGNVSVYPGRTEKIL